MIIFDYSYYRVCDFYNKKKDSSAEMTSSLIISLMQFFTVLDVFILVRFFWAYSIPDNFSKYWFLPLVLLLSAFNWNRYVKYRKFRDFKTVWALETIKEKRRRGWWVMLYMVFSLVFPIFYGILLENSIEETL